MGLFHTREKKSARPVPAFLFHLLCALLFLPPALVHAQEDPLRPGEFEVLWGVRASQAEALFDATGERRSLEESLNFRDGVYQEVSLEARLTYALHPRFSLTLQGPLIRAATLKGEIISQGVSFGRRIEASAGPGDLTLLLAATQKSLPKLRWGLAAAAQLPTGDGSARLPRGTFFPGLGALLWGNHRGAYTLWKGALRLGNGNGPYLEASTEQEVGFMWRNVSLRGLIQGRLPLADGPPIPLPSAREQITGVALRRADLRAGPVLGLHLGTTRIFLSWETPFWGRSEAAGSEIFVGLMVGPKKRSSDL